MRKGLLVLVAVLCLNACCKQKEVIEKPVVSQKEAFMNYKLEDKDRMLIEKAFQAYITFDTNDLNDIKDIDKALNNKDVDRDKIVEEVRLISLEGLRLLEKDSLKQVMNLLDKERDKFCLHPANNVKNELNLFSSSIILSVFFCENEEFFNKGIFLLNISLAHIEVKHTLNGKWDKEYLAVLNGLVNFYSQLGDNANVILHAERLCKYIEEIGGIKEGKNKEVYYTTLSLLKGLYEDSNNKSKEDICKKKLDKLN